MGKKALCTNRRVRDGGRQSRSGRYSSPSGSDPILPVRALKETKEVTQYQCDANAIRGQVSERTFPDTPGEGQGMPKRNKVELSSLSASNIVAETDFNLAVELHEFERLGYLLKSNYEEIDDSLIHYGDMFGILTLNEYPEFFKRVPQHPHYGETSLDNVKPSNAENYWDLFMHLMQRGLSAARKNDKKEIAAIEHRIARFTDQGFDLRHLQAYIRTSRVLLVSQVSLSAELEKIKVSIDVEKKRIDNIISTKPVAETIEELEAEKLSLQKILIDIELALSKKKALLDEDRSIRATQSSPAHDMLLKKKEILERKIMEVTTLANRIRTDGDLLGITS